MQPEYSHIEWPHPNHNELVQQAIALVLNAPTTSAFTSFDEQVAIAQKHLCAQELRKLLC